MEKYIHGLGLTMDDIRVDQNGRIFIVVEENNPRADALYREISLPEEYQTFGNVELVRQYMQQHDNKS